MKYDPEITEKIRALPIADMIGVQLRGKLTGVPCPIHGGSSNNSFFLDRENGFHCFKCGAHGNNFIDYLEAKGYTFTEIYDEFKNEV
jgi:DNA primase